MISFETKTYFKIWDIDLSEKFAKVNMQSSRKDKATDEYVNSKWNYVRFVGDAFTKVKRMKGGERITDVRMAISNEAYIDNTGKKVYPKFYNLVVFDFDIAAGGGNKPVGKPPVDRYDGSDEVQDSSEELPF